MIFKAYLKELKIYLLFLIKKYKINFFYEVLIYVKKSNLK